MEEGNWCLDFSTKRTRHLRHLQKLEVYWKTKFFIGISLQESVGMNRELMQQMEDIKNTLWFLINWCSMLAQNLGMAPPIILAGQPKQEAPPAKAPTVDLGPSTARQWEGWILHDSLSFYYYFLR